MLRFSYLDTMLTTYYKTVKTFEGTNVGSVRCCCVDHHIGEETFLEQILLLRDRQGSKNYGTVLNMWGPSAPPHFIILSML